MKSDWLVSEEILIYIFWFLVEAICVKVWSFRKNYSLNLNVFYKKIK